MNIKYFLGTDTLYIEFRKDAPRGGVSESSAGLCVWGGAVGGMDKLAAGFRKEKPR